MKKSTIFLLVFMTLLLTGCRGTYDKYDETGFISGMTTITDPIKNLEIFWHTGDIDVVYGDCDSIKIEEDSYYVINEQEEVRSKYENYTLTIRYSASNLLLPAANFEKHLTITIPQSYSKIDTINVVNITGDINLAVDCELINIEAVTSDIDVINNYHECSYNIHNVTGIINVTSGAINKVTLELVTGDIKLTSPSITGGVYLTNVTGDILVNVDSIICSGNINNVTGNIEVNTSDFTDTLLSYSIVTGRWITATQNMSSSNGEIKLGNCTYSLHLEVVTGNIKFIDKSMVN